MIAQFVTWFRHRSFQFFLAPLVVLSSLTVLSGASAQNSSAPGLSLVWSKNVGGLKSFGISPHARRLALLTTEGKLALWTAQDGNSVWSVGKQTASHVLVCDGDGLVLLYTIRSLLDTTAQLRNGDTGAILWTQNFNSAVWSCAFNKDGTYAALGTGDSTLYLLDLTNSEAETKVPLDGTPDSIAFSADGDSVLVGQWDRSGLSCLDMAGKTMWRNSGAMNRRYTITSVGPRFVTYIGSSNRHGKSPVVYVVRGSSGQLLWAYDLQSASYNAFARTNDAANVTGISYSRPRQIASSAVTAQKLAAVDRGGQMSWQKGGLFWSPVLICLTPDQDGFVVYDGNRKLYRLDSQGRTVATALLSDTLRQWSVSDDDSSLVVYTHDGQLSLLHVQ